MKKLYNKYYKNSEFGKNVITLATGSSIAQAIPLIISPILTRIYSPNDFGVFAIYTAFVLILGEIANGRYELAIVLPEKDEDAINLFALGITTNLIISNLILILILFFNQSICNILGSDEIKFWLYLAPISIFFIAFFNNLINFNNRFKNYKSISKASVIRSIVVSILQLTIHFVKTGVTGLISGQIISQLFANLELAKNILNNKKLISNISKKNILFLAKRYQNFPKFSLPSVLMNNVSSRLPFFLLSSFFSTAIVGFYSLAIRSISLPTSVIGDSVGKVFFQKSNEFKNNSLALKELIISTYRKLFLIGFIPFSILIVFGDYIFTIVFGLEWGNAGEYSQFLGLSTLFIFISSPLSTLFETFEKQKENLHFNILLLIVRTLAISIGILYIKDAKITIAIIAFTEFSLRVYLIVYLFKLAKIKVTQIAFFTIKYLASSIAIFYIIRFFTENFIELFIQFIYS